VTVDERLARIAGPGQHPIELIESIERLQPPGAAPARPQLSLPASVPPEVFHASAAVI